MSHTLLIVDDEKEIRELLRLYLEKEGYRTVQAENGRVALEKATSTQIDLAIIDIMMPELDGYHLVKKIAEQHKGIVCVADAKQPFTKIFELRLPI